MQICGRWEAPRIVQEFLSVNVTEIKLVQGRRSSVLKTQIDPIEDCLLWLCQQIAAISSRFSKRTPIETWSDAAVSDRDRSCLEFLRAFSGHTSESAGRLCADSVFPESRFQRYIG